MQCFYKSFIGNRTRCMLSLHFWICGLKSALLVLFSHFVFKNFVNKSSKIGIMSKSRKHNRLLKLDFCPF